MYMCAGECVVMSDSTSSPVSVCVCVCVGWLQRVSFDSQLHVRIVCK